MGKHRNNGPRDINYQVGYCQPPVHSRFQPGQSGNPAGRKKGSTNFETDLKRALKQPVKAKRNGKEVVITTQQAAIQVLREKVLKGDSRSIKLWVDLTSRYAETNAEVGQALVTEERDLAIIERIKARLAGKVPNEK